MFTSSLSESFAIKKNDQISSNLFQKRQQFHKQIRREYLDQKFKNRRKMLSKKLQTMQMQKNTMENFSNIINKYKQAVVGIQNIQKQNNQLQQNKNEQHCLFIRSILQKTTQIIQQLHNQLINQQQFLEAILKKYSQQLINIFNYLMSNICLNNNNLISSLSKVTIKDSLLKLQSNLIHIYWIILRQMYENGFKQDNQRYVKLILNQQKCQYKQYKQQEYKQQQYEYENKNNKQIHSLTIYQNSIDILYQLINKQIDIFTLSSSSSQIKLSTRLILLFQCLHILAINQYQFIYHENYIKKYLYKFMKIIILQTKVKIKGLLGWLVEVGQKIIIFNSFRENIHFQNMNDNNKQNKLSQKLYNMSKLSQEQHNMNKLSQEQQSQQILNILFQWCIVPNNSYKQRIPSSLDSISSLYSLLIIKSIFSSKYINLSNNINQNKYFIKILTLLKQMSHRNYQFKFFIIVVEMMKVWIDKIVEIDQKGMLLMEGEQVSNQNNKNEDYKQYKCKLQHLNDENLCIFYIFQQILSLSPSFHHSSYSSFPSSYSSSCFQPQRPSNSSTSLISLQYTILSFINSLIRYYHINHIGIIQKLFGYKVNITHIKPLQQNNSSININHKNNLFIHIVSGLECQYQFIVIECLNILFILFQSISSYQTRQNNQSYQYQRQKNNQSYQYQKYFLQFLNISGDRILQNLCYHRNQYIVTMAEKIIQYFTQDKIQHYTQWVMIDYKNNQNQNEIIINNDMHMIQEEDGKNVK